MDDLAFEQRASSDRAAFDRYRHIFDVLRVFTRKAICFDAIEHAVLLTRDGSPVSIAEPGSGFDQRLQYGSQVESRAANDLEHVGGGSLLLQRFGEVLRALA